MSKFKKSLCIFSVTVIVICCCCFTALADIIHGFDSAVVINTDVGTKYPLQLVSGKDNTWTQGVYIDYTFNSELYLCTDAKFTLDSSNVLRWGSFRFGLWNYGSYSSAIYDISLVLLDDNYNELATLHNFDYSNIDFWQDFFTVPSGSYSSSFEVDARYIAFRILYNPNANSTLYYYTTDYQADISVVDKAIAEQEKTNDYLEDITDDKYESPNGNSIDNVGTVEDEIEESTQEGFSELNKIFKSFSLDTFTDGLGGIAMIYNHIIPQSLWLSNLISISLGLGLFAFLLGIAIWSFGRIGNRDTRVSARRDAKYIKRDGIAAHRPSRR